MRSFAAWCLSRFGRLCGRSPATVRSVSANPGGGVRHSPLAAARSSLDRCRVQRAPVGWRSASENGVFAIPGLDRNLAEVGQVLLPFVVEFKLPAVFLGVAATDGGGDRPGRCPPQSGGWKRTFVVPPLGGSPRIPAKAGTTNIGQSFPPDLVVDLLLLTPVAFAAHRLVIEEGGASGPRDFLRLVSVRLHHHGGRRDGP